MDGDRMEPVRSLRELFASLSHGAADPSAALAASGHGELPGHLMTEAIISYADSAPVEVAEHLSPFVVANSAVPAPDGAEHPTADLHDGFALLTSAPDPADLGHADAHDPHDPGHLDGHDVDGHQLDGRHVDGHLDDLGTHHDLLDARHQGHTGPDDATHGAAAQGSHPATDLFFGHGQSLTVGGQPPADGLPAQSHDDAHADHFVDDGPQHDAWLTIDTGAQGHDVDHLDGWPHDDAAHDDAHTAALPIEHPTDHDLPLDPGHG